MCQQETLHDRAFRRRKIVGWVEPLRDPTLARAHYSCCFAHSGSSGKTSEPHRGSYAPRSTHCKKLECGQSRAVVDSP